MRETARGERWQNSWEDGDLYSVKVKLKPDLKIYQLLAIKQKPQ